MNYGGVEVAISKSLPYLKNLITRSILLKTKEFYNQNKKILFIYLKTSSAKMVSRFNYNIIMVESSNRNT